MPAERTGRDRHSRAASARRPSRCRRRYGGTELLFAAAAGLAALDGAARLGVAYRAGPAELAAGVCLLGLVGLLVAEAAGSRRGRWIAKPLASAAFCATSACLGAAGHRYGRRVLLAQLLGLAGDVLLIPRGERCFVVGLATFLAGHVALATGFAAAPTAAPAVPLLLATAATVPTAVGLHRWLLPRVRAPLAWPVRAYLGVISGVVIAAAAVEPRRQPIAMLGALAFFASDVCVARDRFVAPGLANALAGLPLCYCAQLLLAYSVR